MGHLLLFNSDEILLLLVLIDDYFIVVGRLEATVMQQVNSSLVSSIYTSGLGQTSTVLSICVACTSIYMDIRL